MLIPQLRKAGCVMRKAQMSYCMKNWLFLIFIILTSNLYSQDSLLYETKFAQIWSTRYSLPEDALTPTFDDTSFIYFLNNKENVLPFLIDKIADTSFTNVERKNTNSFYKKGELALIIISNIKDIPFASLTGMQWCICCETGYIPVDFFSYLEKNRLSFQLNYKNYYLANKRKKSSKRFSKSPKT